jgi:hypothetical protein
LQSVVTASAVVEEHDENQLLRIALLFADSDPAGADKATGYADRISRGAFAADWV